MDQSLVAGATRPLMERPLTSYAAAAWANLTFTLGASLRYVSLALALMLWTAVLVVLVALQGLNAFAHASTEHRLAQGSLAFDSFTDERLRAVDGLTESRVRGPGLLHLV